MDNIQQRRLINKIFHIIIFCATLVGIIALVALLQSVLSDGLEWINWNFFTSFASRIPERAGILAALMGSIWIIVITALFSFPIGIGAAIYLEEYADDNWFTRIIQVNISNLAGVPSIVYGILGLGVFVTMLGFSRSILSGGLTLGLLILPIIIVASQEALRSVPTDIRHGSYALGTTKWQMITGVVLPYAFPNILTGTILAIARAFGETAPLIMVGAVTFIAYTPESVFDSFTTLPMQIYSWSSKPQAEFHSLASAAIIVLLVVMLTANAAAIILRNKYQDRIKG